MKKLFSLGILSSLFLFALSCSKDSDPNPTLLGTWIETSTSASGCTNPSENVTTNCIDTDCRTLIIESNSIRQSFLFYSYTTQGDQLILTPSGSTSSLTFTFKVTATTLTITGQDSPANGNCTNTTVYNKLI
ncbi:hypothetical protein BH09BAC3_BH09BAC3_24370 [soil metagenome]